MIEWRPLCHPRHSTALGEPETKSGCSSGSLSSAGSTSARWLGKRIQLQNPTERCFDASNPKHVIHKCLKDNQQRNHILTNEIHQVPGFCDSPPLFNRTVTTQDPRYPGDSQSGARQFLQGFDLLSTLDAATGHANGGTAWNNYIWLMGK